MLLDEGFDDRKKCIDKINTLVNRNKLYDNLYRAACHLIKKYNPCKIENGKCAAGTFCCSGCKYLTEDGCNTNALYCRVWFAMCTPQSKASDQFYTLRFIADQFNLLKARCSKEETFNPHITHQW